MASEAPLAEGALESGEAEGWSSAVLMSFLVIMIFAWIGLENVFLRFGIETIFYKAYCFANNKVTNLFREKVNENEQVVENEQVLANDPVIENPLNPPSHVVSAAVQADEVILNALTLGRRPGIDSGSKTTNTESDLPDEEWHRWSRMKVIVQNEAGQAQYRRLLWKLGNWRTMIAAWIRKPAVFFSRRATPHSAGGNSANCFELRTPLSFLTSKFVSGIVCGMRTWCFWLT